MQRKPLYFLLVAVCFRVFCAEPALWVQGTTRIANPVLLDLILTSDMDTAFRTLDALSGRDDLYMEDIIEGLFYQHSARPRGELYLEVLLDAVIRKNSRRVVDLWLLTNSRAFELLARSLPGLTNARLRTYIITLLPRVEGVDTLSLLMAEGDRLLTMLEDQEGYFRVDQLREALAFFDAVERTGDWSFSELCVSMAERSRQRVVVRKSREIVEAMAGVPSAVKN